MSIRFPQTLFYQYLKQYLQVQKPKRMVFYNDVHSELYSELYKKEYGSFQNVFTGLFLYPLVFSYFKEYKKEISGMKLAK